MEYPVWKGRVSKKAANRRSRVYLRLICFLTGAWVLGVGYAATDNTVDSSISLTDSKALADQAKQMPEVAPTRLDAGKEELNRLRSRLRDAEQSQDILIGERNRLEKQLIDEQGARSKTEEALAVIQMERDRARDALSQTKTGLMEAEASLSQLKTEVEKINGLLEQYRDTLGKTKDALIYITNERDRLAAELKQSQDEQMRMGVQLDQIKSAAGGLRDEMVDLRARLPDSLGGAASLETLKREAGQSASKLRNLHDGMQSNTGGSVSVQRDSAINALRDQQLLIASATRASGVYGLRPKDTLGKVAERFYGSVRRWRLVYGANRHILDNPDRVIPGLTLLIP